MFADDDYSKRESASKQLAEFGVAAADQLKEGLTSESAEMRVRCRRLVQRLQDAETADKLIGHEADLNCVEFSPDGKWLATGDAAGVVKLWDVGRHEAFATLSPN